MNYRLQCSCGHTMYRGAETKEEAVEKFKAALTQDALNQHFSSDHAGEQAPSAADFHSRLDQMVQVSSEALSFTIPELQKTA